MQVLWPKVLVSNLLIMFIEGNEVTHWLFEDGGKKAGLQDTVCTNKKITQVSKLL